MKNRILSIILFYLAANLISAQTGNVGINTTTPSASLNVKGKGNTSATQNFKLENSDGTNLLTVNDDGSVSGSAVSNFAGPGGGTNGKNALVKTTSEAAGSNCPTGGQKIESGQDANADGVLQASEVTATSYVCNGAAGSQGATGATGQGVPTGGTTGQVLTKIDNTNYNTQWTTPNSSGASGVILEASVTTNIVMNQGIYLSNYTNVVDFNNVILAPTTGTLENKTVQIFSGISTGLPTSTTAKSYVVAVAGYYLIDISLVTKAQTFIDNALALPFINICDSSGTWKASYFGSGTIGTSATATCSLPLNTKGRAKLTKLCYLKVGDIVSFPFQNNSMSSIGYLTTDGSSNLVIMKL